MKTLKSFINKGKAIPGHIRSKVNALHNYLYWGRIKVGAVLADRRGESSVGQAVAILIAVVIGALLLAGLYMLFEDTILPTLTQKIKDMFNYNG